MTINYADSFSVALLQWRGSLYKAVITDILVFYILYYCVLVFNLYFLDDDRKVEMSKYIDWFDKGTTYIPLTFLLGFFVAGIVARWWEQFNWISWPDKLMMVVVLCLPGEEHANTRRTIARWSNLQAAMAWRGISVRTKKRFPTEQHLIESGLMTHQELQMFDKLDGAFVPVIWIQNLFRQLHQDKVIDTIQLQMMMKELMGYRDGFAMLFVYDWVTIPLVYTQVVAIATYGYFAFCLVGRQPKLDVESMKSEATIYAPVFTTLQLIFYMGWLKVGQYLMHPFGEDDDDFELNWILDRNTAVAYLIGDQVANQLPHVGTETFGVNHTIHLPHTKASAKIQDIAPADNMAGVKLKDKEMHFLPYHETQALLNDDGESRFGQLVRSLSSRRRRPSSPSSGKRVPDLADVAVRAVRANNLATGEDDLEPYHGDTPNFGQDKPNPKDDSDQEYLGDKPNFG